MPTKTWAVGEEVLAADFNTFVQKQVVATFANAAARDAAIPAPSEGMVCYLIDTDLIYNYRNAKWRPPIGTVMMTSVVGLADVNGSVIGTYDLGSIAQAVNYPFETLSYASAVVSAGFGSSAVNFGTDLYAFGPNAPIQTGSSPIQAVPAGWAQSGHVTVWGNASGASVGYKARVNFLAGSNIHTSGAACLQVVVHL